MENNINKKKFTILDLIICTILLSAAVYFGIHFFSSDKNEQEYNVTYKVTLTLENSQIQNYAIGDKVLTADGENIIGEITNINFVDATESHYFISESVITSESDVQKQSDEKEFKTSNNKENSSASEEENSMDSSEENSSNTESDLSSDSQDDESSFETLSSSIEEILPTEPFVEKHEIPILGYSFVTITISAKLDKVSNQYSLNNKPLTIDSDVEITTSRYSAVGKCIQVSEFTSVQQESAE